MKKIEIKPLVGIVIEEIGEVLLGGHKNDLYAILGHPSTDNKDSIFMKNMK